MAASAGVDGGICKSFSTMGIGFGFNNPKFSDRILRIEVIAEDSHHTKESPSTVKTVHISSPLLASQSPFFYKMFSIGMKESEQELVDLTINASEESALMDLLQFLYKHTLEAKTHEDLLKVLVLAGKYRVDLCITYCAQTVSSLPMTFGLAMSCINLPSTVFDSGNTHLRSLVDAATRFLSKNFFSEHRKAALKLPLKSIENLLSWDSLEVDCEDDVYDFVLQWMSTHCEDINERRRVFSSRLLHLIRFPYMSYDKLKCVLQSEELEKCEATKMVVEALPSNPWNDQVLSTSSCQKRAYKLLPVAVTALNRPFKEWIVYADLRKEDCYSLAENNRILRTQNFYVEHESLYIELIKLERWFEGFFGARLWRNYWSGSSNDQRMHVEVATRSKSTGKFVTKGTHYWPIGDESLWCEFGSWDSFRKDDQYFYDGDFYIRINLCYV